MAKHEPEVEAAKLLQENEELRRYYEGHVKPMSDALAEFIDKWTPAQIKFLVESKQLPASALDDLKDGKLPPAHRSMAITRAIDLLLSDYFSGVRGNDLAIAIAAGIIEHNFQESLKSTIEAVRHIKSV